MYNKDLRRFLSDGGIPRTWDTIARWTEGLLRIDENLKWGDLEKDTDARRKKYLPKICAMNMKKTSGGHSAIPAKVRDAAKRDSGYLRQQLGIYSPNIIILCGTEDVFYKYVYNDKEYEGLRTSKGIWYVNDNGTIIISFAHPDLRHKSMECVFYYGLIEAAKEILQKEKGL
jgi:hypothetical protein